MKTKQYVIFDLGSYISQPNFNAVRDAFGENAYDMVRRATITGKSVSIRTTNKKFVQFLYYRNNYGGDNAWKSLNVRLQNLPEPTTNCCGKPRLGVVNIDCI